MEIQVGEYVKSTDGFIAKVEEIDEDFIDFDSPIIIGYDGLCSYFGRDQLHFIAKHSFNIIDLIEKGDFVNGQRVEEKHKDGIFLENMQSFYKEKEIETILTKEQFEAMEYEVK